MSLAAKVAAEIAAGPESDKPRWMRTVWSPISLREVRSSGGWKKLSPEGQRNVLTTWVFEFSGALERPEARPTVLTVIERGYRTRVQASLTDDEARDYGEGAERFREAADLARNLGMSIRDYLAAADDDRVTTYYPRPPDRSPLLLRISDARDHLRAAVKECVFHRRPCLRTAASVLHLARQDLRRVLRVTRNRAVWDMEAADQANKAAVDLGRVGRVLEDLAQRTSEGEHRLPGKKETVATVALVSRFNALLAESEFTATERKSLRPELRRMSAVVLTDTLNLCYRNRAAVRLFDLQSAAPINGTERAAERQRAIAAWVKHFKNVEESQNRVRPK